MALSTSWGPEMALDPKIRFANNASESKAGETMACGMQCSELSFGLGAWCPTPCSDAVCTKIRSTAAACFHLAVAAHSPAVTVQGITDVLAMKLTKLRTALAV